MKGRRLQLKGKTQNVKEWAKELGVNRRTLHNRIKNKPSIEQAFNY